MRRARIERQRTLRVWHAHNLLAHDGLPSNCTCDEQPGRFRKGERAGGCGRQHCGLCRRYKLHKELTARDYRAALSLLEWGSEFGFAVRMPRKPWWK
ncbi:MAG: hypothetical protein O7G30_16745 [Proteobacteria bacterium]|nr:hypothetical protein [Pseudomonadota bacterium]